MRWDCDNPEFVRATLEPEKDFGLSRAGTEELPDLFKTWSLGPVIRTRDSNVREQANAEALLAHLGQRKFRKLRGDWKVSGFGHWAVGHVDHLCFRAVEEDQKTPTRINRILQDWFNALEIYPIADEKLLAIRLKEDCLSSMQREFKETDGLPDDWAEKTYRWLAKNDPDQVRPSDGWGGCPTSEAIEVALKALGLRGEA